MSATLSFAEAAAVLTPEQRERTAALVFARLLLKVKAGQHAERALEPTCLIELAEYILGPLNPEVTIDLGFTPDFGPAGEAIRDGMLKARAAREGRR